MTLEVTKSARKITKLTRSETVRQVAIFIEGYAATIRKNASSKTKGFGFIVKDVGRHGAGGIDKNNRVHWRWASSCDFGDRDFGRIGGFNFSNSSRDGSRDAAGVGIFGVAAVDE